MRAATAILSLVLMVVVGAQSCTVYAGGSAMGQEGKVLSLIDRLRRVSGVREANSVLDGSARSKT